MLADKVFSLLCDCTSLAEFQLKCAMQTSFQIGSKPLPKGMALQLFDWLHDSMAGHRYMSWSTWNMPVIGSEKTKVDQKRMLRLLANMAELAHSTPAFSAVSREEAEDLREFLMEWARSEKSKEPSHPESAELLAAELKKLKSVEKDEDESKRADRVPEAS